MNAITRRTFLEKGASAGVVGAVAVGSARSPVLGANERIGIGLIGTGSRAGSHLQSITWLKSKGANLEITALNDVYRPRMQKMAEGLANARQYPDYQELLADRNVDVVCISTPDHLHGYQTIDAIKAGKDVYCEKPVTHWRQFDLIKQLNRVVNTSDRVFQLGTQGMSDAAWSQMKQMVQKGMIGKPIHVECGYFRVGDWGERGMPIDDPNAKPGSDLNWDAFLGDSPKRAFDVSRFFRWRMYEDYAGGPVTDLYPHSLTPVISILDLGMPATVVATGGKFRYEEREVPDTFNLLIDYAEGLTVAVLGTQGNTFCNPDKQGRGAESRVPVMRGWEGTLTVCGKEIVYIPLEAKDKEERFPIERDQNQVDHWQNFLDCCRSRKRETFSGVDLAYRTQTPLIMGMWAFKNGKVAKFDTQKERIVV
ncbi:MAG: gfo/Idh/MocA family oxidoreductase [Acidobacteria bacterium]|nr:MAG: gfo/Idh/MocA family oxidoreductase [Acidobacteriota bacterium]